MRNRLKILASLLVLGAGGFAAASIASGGSLVGAGTTGTTSTTPSRVTICHHTGSKKHPFHTITVAAAAVPAHLRHGDTLGPCAKTASRLAGKRHGKGHGKTTGTTTGTQTGSTTSGHGQGNGGQGNGGQGNSGQGNGNGKH